jgi:hypothetical protein
MGIIARQLWIKTFWTALTIVNSEVFDVRQLQVFVGGSLFLIFDA